MLQLYWPTSALVVKQRLGGPIRALQLLLKANWPTSTSVEELGLGSPLGLCCASCFPVLSPERTDFYCFCVCLFFCLCLLCQAAGFPGAQPSICGISGIALYCHSSSPEVLSQSSLPSSFQLSESFNCYPLIISRVKNCN